MNIEEKIKKNVSLKDYTTFRIGGKAKYFLQANSKQEIIEAIKWAKANELPFFVLGQGSNILASDRRYNGVIIKIQNEKCRFCPRAEGEGQQNRAPSTYFEKISAVVQPIVEAEAGLSLAKLAGLALQNSLTGMEWLMGIPGTAGGAIYGNAGAFGKTMGDVVDEIEVYDNAKIKIFEKDECCFGYRESVFKKNKNLIILSAKIKLQTGDKAEIEKKMKEFFQAKKQTQPLEYFSAGCIFKNCEVPSTNFFEISAWQQYSEVKDFQAKRIIPAAWLIEKCGLKGKRIGKAQISNKHANFIVNMNRAKARDVKKLVDLIKKQVKRKFNIDLQEEIQYLNF